MAVVTSVPVGKNVIIKNSCKKEDEKIDQHRVQPSRQQHANRNNNLHSKGHAKAQATCTSILSSSQYALLCPAATVDMHVAVAITIMMISKAQ